MFEPNLNGIQTNPPQTQAGQNPSQDSILDDNQPDFKIAPPKQKMSILSMLILVLTILVSGAGIYLRFEINTTNSQIESTQTAIEAQAQNIITEDNQEVTLSTKKSFLDLKTSQRTFFKNIIQNVNDDIIDTSEFRSQSYTINPQGLISLNIVSTPLNLSPLNEAAQLIERLEQRNYFSNVFIPGVTQALTENGLEQIQFNLQLTHTDQTGSSNSTPATQEIPQDEDESDTSRPSPILN